MHDADALYQEIVRIIGGDPLQGGAQIHVQWESEAAGRNEIKRIKLMKKELAMVKKDAAASIKEVKAHFVAQRSNVQAGLVSSFFGRQSAARDRVAKRENAKREEAQHTQPFERIRGIVDQLSIQLDRHVIDLERRLAS